MDSLKGDGYHVKPEFGSVLDRTYACAFLGIDVPFPTPWVNLPPVMLGADGSQSGPDW